MSAPTHIMIFKHKDAKAQEAIQALWAKMGATMICEFAATFSIAVEDEPELRQNFSEYLDPIDNEEMLCFFGRTDGSPVAP